jgi:hypothetical protein
LDRFLMLDRLLDLHHPVEPHHHLVLLAVCPELQNTGRANALLAHHHGVLDAGGWACYAEASGGACRDLYERHGYQTGAPFGRPGMPLLWPMWRPPLPAGPPAAV